MTQRCPEGCVPTKTSAEQVLEYFHLAKFIHGKIVGDANNLPCNWEQRTVFDAIIQFYAKEKS